ncbi:LacI family transcriptional regulator [Streptomyces sp. YC504]|uniref:LacI family transcriptional regulator n=1 Tax=Streptomyces mesophilus TaxID=1775132 RepID=A0A6G4XSM3_9ACTN|nr:LacI family transcriptional regulator [Streptomyces mesophilus]
MPQRPGAIEQVPPARRPGGPVTQKVTIKDVAAQAGVSVATVSRVLAGTYPTSAHARTKVMRAVNELDYVPNAHARGLAGNGRKTVAVLIQAVHAPFYGAIAHGVEAEAAACGRLSLVCQTGGDPDRELALVQMMREQRAETVVLAGGVVEDDAYRERIARYAQGLEAAGSRLVLCGRPVPSADLPALIVEYDNEAGARAVTSHLLAAGHRDIAYIGHIPGLSTSEQRLAGFRAGLADFGIAPERARIIECDGLELEYGLAAAHRILAACGGKPDFTAVFAADDWVATGVIRALHDYGLDVPGDVSVVGYNDERHSAHLDPPLTTVHIPGEELGRTAVRMALRDEALGTAGARRQEKQVLGTHIVVRKSVARVGS